eukprot:GFUD01139772.1.p1 GENE.GFUD01139772.1~~GFUD01139772.1.p1  ORF type:complete len:231 (+),score=50.24 GFUD01139772.1:39-731(+)
MAKSQNQQLDQLAYRVFEDDMKERMKPSLMQIKAEQGFEAYLEGIRNTIAGCRLKWKCLPKEVKQEFGKRVKKGPENAEVEDDSVREPTCSSGKETATEENYFSFRRRRFEELKSSNVSFKEKSRIVSEDWELVKGDRRLKTRNVKNKTGYDLFRQEHSRALRETGLKGNILSAKLGAEWRKLSVKSKKMYNMKAYVSGQINASSNLTKTTSVKLNRKEVSIKRVSSLKY